MNYGHRHGILGPKGLLTSESVLFAILIDGIVVPLAATGDHEPHAQCHRGHEGLRGELTVKSQLLDGQFQFSVTDSGVGLPKVGSDQTFSAFFTTKPEGSGMGLAISRSIVESHGGRLWATANDGRGATFHFTLPTEVTELSPVVVKAFSGS